MSLFNIQNESNITEQETITIGSQTWAKKNLARTYFRNGDPLLIAQTSTEFSASGAAGIPACFPYYSTSSVSATQKAAQEKKRSGYAADYGYLYNYWALVDPRTIAPQGFRVPSSTEILTLYSSVGGATVAGGNLKEPGSAHWPPSNVIGSGNSGSFNWLPGGRYDTVDGSDNTGSYGYLGTNTRASSTQNKRYRVDYNIAEAYVGESANSTTGVYRSFVNGHSVRCLKITQENLPTVIVGTQTWTNKNLDVATYSDGTPIPEASSSAQWIQYGTNKIGAWCYHSSNPANDSTYGKLYNWYAVAGIHDTVSLTDASKRKSLAPIGYHIPTDAEWTTLTDSLGGESVAGGKMKETGTTHWLSPNQNATNSSGFTGLPGGYRDDITGVWNNLGTSCYWWSLSEFPSTSAWARLLSWTHGNANRGGYDKGKGFAVRCLTGDPAPLTLASLTTTAASSITANTATGGGNISSNGGNMLTSKGVIWSTSPNPTIDLSTKTANTETSIGSFSATITGLVASTLYYIRAYAVTLAGVAYGNERTFTTANAVIPTLTTTEVLNLETSTPSSGGDITADGGAPVTARGIVWSTSANPTIALPTRTSDGIGTGTFTSYFTGLSVGTHYFVKAYATNSAGTAYGDELEFDTQTPTPPLVSTTAISNIKNFTATGGGNVISDGGSTVLERGVVWSTSANPTTALPTKTSNGGGTGTFISNLTGLTPSTLYYVRAYARNAYGTSYGPEFITFTTITLPSVTTKTPITGIGATSATGGGTVTSEGGGTVTARGVVWNTSANPTVDLATKTIDGSGLGTFTSTITYPSDTFRRTYYVRAYATNNAGTSYGPEVVTFQSIILPTVSTTSPITSIAQTTATGGGNVTADGGSTVTARGVVWSTSANPIVALPTKTSNGTGPGIFTSNLTGLTYSTLYYVRAYATNGAGTAYGPEVVTFTTLAATIQTVTTLPIQYVTDTTAEGNGVFTLDAYSMLSERGICYSNTQTLPTISGPKKPNSKGQGYDIKTGLTGLNSSTTYYARAYVTTTEFGTVYGDVVSFTTAAVTPTLANHNQVWTTTNYAGTTYRDGSTIPEEQDQTRWKNAVSGAWCYYENNPASGSVYGKLYNWYAIRGIWNAASLGDPNQRKVFAPTGYHVPTLTEWKNLVNHLGGETVAGGTMKETGLTHWADPNTGATNSSGFTALGAGRRAPLQFIPADGVFNYIKRITNFWTNDTTTNGGQAGLIADSISLSSGMREVTIPGNDSIGNGLSVRLIQD